MDVAAQSRLTGEPQLAPEALAGRPLAPSEGTTPPPDARVTQASSVAAKIALFRSLFCGREDIYARRFESVKSGRSGYAPACGNEWVRGVCEKPRIKCADCPHRRFLPITDEVVRWHLSGRDSQNRDFVMGVYAMLADETCFFLAVDLDGPEWSRDASAFLETCRMLGVPAALERSRSGDGGHVWLFFDEPISAGLARKLGAHLLTETMERRPEIGLRSYDRLFPNQDTLPKGGFGNLIALPLQKLARRRGHSEFLDDQLRPWPDQWAFLTSLRKLGRGHVETLVRDAEARGRVVGVRMAAADEDDDSPWHLPPSRRRRDPPIEGPLPGRIELLLGDQIYIEKGPLAPALRNRVLRLAAFQNPEFYRAQAMRLPTYDKPRIVACAEEHARHFALPRGCLDEVKELFAGLKIAVSVRDERCGGTPLALAFAGTLRPDQQAAADALLRHETGVLSATTAFGKTVVASWLIARRGVNALVLVHRQQLLEQWIERLSTFLNVPAKSIGRLGGGRRKLTGGLDVALIQSLVRKGAVDDCVANYGHLVIDECHHLSARSFELVARRAKAKFVTGLSATVTRKDGHQPIIFMQCGPIRHRVDALAQAAARPFAHHVFVRPTGFRPGDAPADDARLEFQRLCAVLSADAARNRLIVGDVLAVVREGRSPLLLTERTEHLRFFTEQLSAEVPHVIALQGGMGRKALAATLAHAARAPEAEAQGENRARSASEAFFFRRLQTLPETAGRFRLNAELPIPFDSRGQMEVDLLCAEARLAIELDGAQHLADAEAYRRDRKKDALLQQHGYFVLRFLATDIGRQLDDVLDRVLAALVHRRGRPGS